MGTATSNPDTRQYQWGEARSVFSFGQNSCGQLGHDDKNNRSAPTRIELPPEIEIVDVACGNEQTTLLSATGRVYTCGYNFSGQCGVSAEEPILRPMRVEALRDKKVARVFGYNGSEHVAVLTESGALYTFGRNDSGQLGLGTAAASVAQPSLVSELSGKRVVDVAFSFCHTLLVTAEGDLFACGQNNSGQLGMGDRVDRSVPTLVASLHGQPVRAVACGKHHTVVSVASGGVYAFGMNKHGQLGTGASSDRVLTPVSVAGELQRATVTRLACGYFHTLAVTDSGSVYSFGLNGSGELGLGHKRAVATPTMIDALARVHIVDVVCGSYHSFALSDDGKVYPFGRNTHGQLGLETTVDCLTPQIVPSLRNVVVAKIAAGFDHSVCLATNKPDTAQSPLATKSLSSDLRRLLNNPLRSDVTFLVEGVAFHAHSCILMARCEPLDKMLDGRTRDGSLPQIEIPECSHDVFAALLEFLYTDEVAALHDPNSDAGFLLALLSLADQYLVDVLRSHCERALLRILSVDNACLVLQQADFRDAFTLKRKCLAFILDRFGDVIATVAFSELPSTLLQEVMQAALRNGVVKPPN